MVTKNYANFVNGVKQSRRGMTWKGYITTPEGIERLIDIKSHNFYSDDQSKFYAELFNSVNNRDYTDLSSARNGMFFGSGSATPTSDDYKLDMFPNSNKGLSQAFDLLGNTVVVPVIYNVAKRLLSTFVE